MRTSAQFSQIKSPGTVRDQVITAITDAIQRGDFKPGTQLPPERDLATMLGVSRSATRDAIKTLAGAGVLEARHGYGTFVSNKPIADQEVALESALHLDSKQLVHLFELRPLLEGPASEWAALRLDREHRERLEELLATLGRVDGTTPVDVLADLDRRVHGLIASATGNRAMMVLTYDLLDLLSNIRSFSLQLPGRAIASVEEHKSILHAILEGQATEARTNMEKHIRSVEESLQRALTFRTHQGE